MPNKRADRLNAMAASDAALASNLAVVSTSAGVLQSSRYDVLMGALARLGKLYIVTDPRYGGIANGSTITTQAVQDAIDDAPAGSTIYFPKGTGNYVVDRSLSVTKKGIVFLFGGNRDQNGISFAGTGPLIELGSDDGQNWDDANYNGVATGFSWLNGSATFAGTKVALSNGLGSGYGAGTMFIRDWRSGNVRIENASISAFDHWFWGVQSDINIWRNLTVSSCHSGALIGPRSDQLTAEHIWTFHNDRVWDITGAQNCVVKRWITDSDGSATINPCRIRNSTPSIDARFATTRVQCGNVVEDPWLESLSGGAVMDVEAFFEVNVGDTTKGGGVVIKRPAIRVHTYNSVAEQHVLHLVKADNHCGVTVEHITGVAGSIPWNNLRSVFKHVDTSGAGISARYFFSDADLSFGSRLIENHSAVSLFMPNVPSDGFGNQYLTNSAGGTGGVTLGTVGINRRLHHNASAFTSGLAGDVAINRSFAQGRTAMWINAGSTTNVPIHAPTVSGDRGDANVTLTVESDHEIQRFATTLTTNRTITLSTTGALNGHRFKIVRTGLGAFTLDVGGLKTIPSATAATVEVMYDGSAWRLVSYGAL